VIGVIGDVRHVGLDAEPVPEIYRANRRSTSLTYVVRTAGPPSALARIVQTTVEARVPVKLADIRPFDEFVNLSVRVPQFRARLFGLMGLLVAGLAFIGVFSVTAYAVVERQREIGIRMALGARPAQTVRLMMAQTSLPVTAGLIAGVTVAFNSNRLIAHFLFATSPADARTMALVLVTVLASGLLATYIPARRALRVDPTVALRAE
jgi:putative ABC transport system permease protein